MNRQEKAQVIESLKNNFQKSSASFLVGYKGLTVAQMADLRKKIRNEGGVLQVTKVTLMKRAVDETPEIEGLRSLLGNQIALVFTQAEPPAVAKILSDFSKDHEQLKLVGGFFESSVLTEDSIKQIAALPSREVLLAQVGGTLKALITKLAQVLNIMLVKPLMVLKEIEKKKS